MPKRCRILTAAQELSSEGIAFYIISLASTFGRAGPLNVAYACVALLDFSVRSSSFAHPSCAFPTLHGGCCLGAFMGWLVTHGQGVIARSPTSHLRKRLPPCALHWSISDWLNA